MTRIAQIEDRGAVLAWSPISSQADVIAVGTKDSGSIGFDDYGGEFEFFNLNIASGHNALPTPEVVGSVKTTSRFSSIGWTPLSLQGRYSKGLIASGMADSTVQLWDPDLILQGQSNTSPPEPISIIKKQSSGSVSAVAFNNHYDSDSAHLLAMGGSNGEVLIASLERPEQPDVFSPHADGQQQPVGSEVTSMGWNSQVAHIVASASGDGTTSVWDLRQRKKWCEIRCEHGGIAVTDLAWNPTEGLHIITASGDDRNPVMKLWDLRSSTSMPLATLEGHSGGVLCVAWCPYDASLLLSCGKDNRTLLWDLYAMRPIDELLADEAVTPDKSSNQTSMYGGSLGTSTQRRYDVQWSPLRRGVVSTCSFDRKVEALSVVGAMNKSGRPPSWLKRPSGVSNCFGGALVSFGGNSRSVELAEVVEEPDLKRLSLDFEQALSSKDFAGFCRSKADKASRAGDSQETQIWGFMQIIFEANARVQILHYLGFDPTSINQLAMGYTEDCADNGDDAATPPMSKNAEDIVKRALLVGDFEAAVECCFRSGNLADALVLSSCGGADLWAKTQAEYFEREEKKRPFLKVVSAVIHNQMGELVASSEPTQWQETLAILSTYGKSDEFPSLCRALGSRLEEAGDPANASLCYMCALDLENAAKYWMFQLEQTTGPSSTPDLVALHSFVEKVTVFLQAPEVNAVLPIQVADLFTVYARTLADQGLLETASKYCSADSQTCNELRDRLYHSGAGPACRQVIGAPPPFPFYRVNIGVAPKGSSAAAARQGLLDRQPAYQPSQPAATQPQSDQLPPGWVALHDPSSGRTYYANQSTGESSWEKPKYQVSMDAQQTNPTIGYQLQQHSQQAQYQPQQELVQNQSTVVNGSNSGATPHKVSSKYGDGFVSSASHPELGEQYGNVGTSNPHFGGPRGGIAAVNSTTASKPPVSGTFHPSIADQLSAEHQPVASELVSIVSSLGACSLAMSEKKQLSEIEKGVAIYLKKVAMGSIDNSVTERVRALATAVRNKDYASASGIQTGLVNSDWMEHKDWIKGMKFLIQLSMKKL